MKSYIRFVFNAVFWLVMITGFLTLQASAEQYSNEDMHCLYLNVYHEARGEPIEGQLAVAHVTLNRVKSSRFPDTICKVVKQGKYKNGQPVKDKCQFHWWCDGRGDKVHNQRDWKSVKTNVDTAVKWYKVGEDFSKAALFYHTKNMTTRWSRKFTKVATIGKHAFFDGVKK